MCNLMNLLEKDAGVDQLCNKKAHTVSVDLKRWNTHQRGGERRRKKDKTVKKNGSWIKDLQKMVVNMNYVLRFDIRNTKKQKDTKSTVMIENAEWKKRRRMNKRTKETTEAEATEDRRDLGDIFSSSLVRDVLYSAGWSLRWGPLEIIMTACCFRQPHTFHWKTINKLPHFSQALM